MKLGPGKDYSTSGQQHQYKEQYTRINKTSIIKAEINMRNKHKLTENNKLQNGVTTKI